MSDTIRVGIIGTSWWAEAMHLRSLASHPRASVAAIAGRDQERAGALAAAFGIPRVYGDHREMLAGGGLDAVVVVTPDDLHYEVTMEALGRGLHVLCEKPLALTGGQAREMLRAATRAGVRHMVGFSWRGLPHYRYLRQLVASGYVGRCHAVQLSYLTGGGARGTYSWRYDGRRSNGALGNYGAHMIDLARWLAGDICSVSAHLAARVERPLAAESGALPANDTALLAVAFASGAAGTIHVSEVAQTGERFHDQQVRLYGDAGTLEADLTLAGSDLRRGVVRVAAEIRGVRRGESSFQVLPVPPEFLAGAAPDDLFGPFTAHPVADRLFLDSIIAGGEPEPSFADGLEVQMVMDAAVESHRSGRWTVVGSRGSGGFGSAGDGNTRARRRESVKARMSIGA